MKQAPPVPRFHDVLETVERLPPDDQAALVQIIHQRLRDLRRTEVAQDVAEARADLQKGNVRRGSVSDVMRSLT